MPDFDLEHILSAKVGKESWFSSDTRSFQAGDVFVALRGDKDDGHRYLDQLLGPALLVAERGHPFLSKYPASLSSRLCLVENTSTAHRQIAAFFRKRFQGPLIAIAGSNGKTTTKDCLAHILQKKLRCAVTKKSQNGEQGIPKTMELLRPGTEIGIIEVGIDAPGDMHRHSQLVQATHGIITSIGEEHLQYLRDIHTVFHEETELFRFIQRQGGLTWVPTDDPYLKTLAAETNIRLVETYTEQTSLPFINPLAMRSIGLAKAVAQHLGISEQEIDLALADFRLPPGRGNVLEAWPETLVIADFYNANPPSMQGSLEAAIQLAKRKNLPLHLILGDMLDLGSESRSKHLNLIPLLNQTEADSLCFIGPQMGILREKFSCTHYLSVEAAQMDIQKIMAQPGIYLVKGSRGIHLEKLMEAAFDQRGLPLSSLWKTELSC